MYIIYRNCMDTMVLWNIYLTFRNQKNHGNYRGFFDLNAYGCSIWSIPWLVLMLRLGYFADYG